MQQELISVIMPVYNSEKYLVEAIESILNQTYSHFEFLIFDDASTDGSRAIIKQFARTDNRIRPYYHDVNKGYVVHLNKGIELTKGNLIARMDSDDISLPDRLGKQVNLLIERPEVVAVGSSSIRIDANGEVIGNSKRQTESSELFWQSFFSNPLAHPTVMYKKDAVLTVGGYNPDKLPAEDYDLWTRLLKIGQLANIAEPLLKYREHGESVSVKKREIQKVHSRESLRKHWKLMIQTHITDEESLLLKGFHKGYDQIQSASARILFYKIFKLRKILIKKFRFVTQKSNISFFNVSFFLISRVRKESSWYAFILIMHLIWVYPASFFKMLKYAKG